MVVCLLSCVWLNILTGTAWSERRGGGAHKKGYRSIGAEEETEVSGMASRRPQGLSSRHLTNASFLTGLDGRTPLAWLGLHPPIVSSK